VALGDDVAEGGLVEVEVGGGGKERKGEKGDEAQRR